MTLAVVTPATTPVVSAEEIREHVRQLAGVDAAKLARLVKAATFACERIAGRTFVATQYEKRFDAWPGGTWLELPRPPLVSVDSVKYVDDEGTVQTLASSVYAVRAGLFHAGVRLAFNQSWPTARAEPDAIRVTFTAGYGTTGESVPEHYRAAVELLAGHLYENREATLVGTSIVEVPLGVAELLALDSIQL